jgi:hypothetical protein
MRLLTERMNVFRAKPSNHLLSKRENNEAYCMANPGQAYAIYFTGEGSVQLDLTDADGRWVVHWLKIYRSTWTQPRFVEGGDTVALKTPSDEQWAVLLKPAN